MSNSTNSNTSHLEFHYFSLKLCQLRCQIFCTYSEFTLRILFYGPKNNFWGLNREEGPGRPDVDVRVRLERQDPVDAFGVRLGEVQPGVMIPVTVFSESCHFAVQRNHSYHPDILTNSVTVAQATTGYITPDQPIASVEGGLFSHETRGRASGTLSPQWEAATLSGGRMG